MRVRYSPLEYLLKTMPNSKAELLQGTLDLLILRTLTASPMHGYAIAQRILQRSNDVLVVEEGSLYPCLYRMEDKGWISSFWGKSENNRRAKYYTLTRAGRKQLEEEIALWERVHRAITLVLQTA
jgi:PadR family transcriptional regulator PadR